AAAGAAVTWGVVAAATDVAGSLRVGVVTQPGELLVKERSLSGPWVDEYGPKLAQPAVTAAYIAGDLLGAITAKGEFLVKRGGLARPWVDEYGPATGSLKVVHASLAAAPGNPDTARIGVLTAAGDLLVKQGGLSSAWVAEFGPALNQAPVAGCA